MNNSNTNEKSNGRNDILKLIAIITMFIDHVGVLLFPQIVLLRVIGRIAFPIFAYSLALGFRYTTNLKKYALRLLLFGLIAQIPYMYLNYQATIHPLRINVILFLLYGLGLLKLLATTKKYWLNEELKSKIISLILCLLLIFFTILPELLTYYISGFTFSYNLYGFLLIYLFYFFRDKPITLVIGYIFISVFSIIVLNDTLFQGISILGLFCIIYFNYSHIKIKLPRYVAYLFYPIHIAILVMIRLLLGGPIY